MSTTLSKAEKRCFNQCVVAAREAEASQRFADALENYLKAHKIFSQPKLLKKITKLKALSNDQENVNPSPLPKKYDSEVTQAKSGSAAAACSMKEGQTQNVESSLSSEADQQVKIEDSNQVIENDISPMDNTSSESQLCAPSANEPQAAQAVCDSTVADHSAIPDDTALTASSDTPCDLTVEKFVESDNNSALDTKASGMAASTSSTALYSPTSQLSDSRENPTIEMEDSSQFFQEAVAVLRLPHHIPELLEISEISSVHELINYDPSDLAVALGIEEDEALLLIDHCRLANEPERSHTLCEEEVERKSQETDTNSVVSHEQKVEFNKLVAAAKQKVNEGVYAEALMLYEASQKIVTTDKVQNRIAKLQEIINTVVTHTDGFVENKVDGTCWLDDTFAISSETYEKLYEHQREGVKWFWKLHCRGNSDREFRFTNYKPGGILGDDMGLGKTVQVATFLSGILDGEHSSTALLVLPVSLIANWEKELKIWTPDTPVEIFHGNSKVQRRKAAQTIRRRGGILLTTYGLVTSAAAEINGDVERFSWDYMILDEGHKIKKHTTQVAKKCREVRARRRFILTGTPVQNNLAELWSLFDFVVPGLLQSLTSFKEGYATPICNGTLRNATETDRIEGTKAAEELQALIRPFFLRRDKKQVFGEDNVKVSTEGIEDITNQLESMTIATKDDRELPEKVEFVCWVYLASKQLDMYRSFVESDKVRELLNSTRSPLAALTVLKKICDHPRLLANYGAYREALSLDTLISTESTVNRTNTIVQDSFVPITPARSLVSARRKQCPSLSRTPKNSTMALAREYESSLIEESGKLKFALELLHQLHSEGHRVLLFSQSKQMLNIITSLLPPNHRHLRLDGSISDPQERQRLVNQFNSDPSIFAFLLTTQVGGVGLTLTGADRVIIYDPSWNPSQDAQAVDRAYRIGQQNRVLVYRLISCGTVEEKIYRKQVFKQGLSDTVVKNVHGKTKSGLGGYFTKDELKALFTLENDGASSTTQKQLAEEDGCHQDFDSELTNHAAFLESLSIYGLSNHGLLFNSDGNSSDGIESSPHVVGTKSCHSEEQECTAATSVTEGIQRIADACQNHDGTIPTTHALAFTDVGDQSPSIGFSQASPTQEDRVSDCDKAVKRSSNENELDPNTGLGESYEYPRDYVASPEIFATTDHERSTISIRSDNDDEDDSTDSDAFQTPQSQSPHLDEESLPINHSGSGSLNCNSTPVSEDKNMPIPASNGVSPLTDNPMEECFTPNPNPAKFPPEPMSQKSEEEDFYSSEEETIGDLSHLHQNDSPSSTNSPLTSNDYSIPQFDFQAQKLFESSDSENEEVSPFNKNKENLLQKELQYDMLDPSTQKRYCEIVSQAAADFAHGQLENCLAGLLDALKLCDDDIWLHRCCLIFAKQVPVPARSQKNN